MTSGELITAFVSLFVVIDPIGLAPIFVALTAGMSAQARRKIAVRAVGIAALILIVFALCGQALLSFLGISLPAFRIAGGLLLFLTALEMLFEQRSKRREEKVEENDSDPSVFPLALPLIAGPGAIATVILLAGDGRNDLAHVSLVIAVGLAVLLLVFLLFLLAAPLEKLLGPTGINVVTRLLGMLLAALSVQFVIDGVRASFGV